ncbi:MAG TPA: MFS transporter [Gammaproteobacteria bacterium]|nr:MFS transporter [Gammaproteobacteria bacterium]
MQDQKKPSLFANRDFKLLFMGSSVSALGDQFTLVALPWLVLKLTGNPAALGLVLAAMALPRAVFMLIGGAVVDRMSPRRVLLVSRAVNAVFIALLAILVMAGAIQMWLVYLVALGVGISTAFVYPAGTSIMPQLVERDQLQSANAMFMGMRQMCMFLGPALAGFVIAGGSKLAPTALADATGMGWAFTIDAVSFIFSLVSLWMVRIHTDYHPPKPEGGVLADVMKGLKGVWEDVPLRAFILYVSAVAVFVGGPIQVGLPVLANSRLDLGAASLGILMTANGGGIIVGSVLSGVGARLSRGRLGIMVLCIDFTIGLAVLLLTQVHSTLAGAALLALTGVLGGIAQISVFTWIQQRVPQAMLGRTMSVVMLTFLGLGPLSAAVAGVLLNVVSLTALFGGAGLALSATAAFCLTRPSLRSIGVAKPLQA